MKALYEKMKNVGKTTTGPPTKAACKGNKYYCKQINNSKQCKAA